jgi:hypothetical protein
MYFAMNLTEVQDQARMALIVGAKMYDRLFAGIRVDELDGDILFVYAKSERSADEIEDKFSMHISVIASKILDREVNIVMVLPRQLVH